MGSQPEAKGVPLLPWPVSLDRGSGEIRLQSGRFEPVCPGSLTERVVRAFDGLSRRVSERTGLPLAEPLPVRLQYPGISDRVPGPDEDESYWLVADDAGLYVDAASEWGVLRALATLEQLIGTDGRLPHIAVDDRPRFTWRGLLLDPARHFLPVDDLLRTLDGMASCKLNVLHLHLSDDQGFRFPVPGLPRLASPEAYTSEDLDLLVTHAADRGIRVVPEIDMPGHVTSWLTAYPELGARQIAPTTRFGVHGACLDPSNEAVYVTIGTILDALVAVFPDPCLHVGGDEVSPGWWTEDPGIRSLMAREGLADVHEVQGYFNRRVGEMVTSRGRQAVAWDEALDAGCPADWILQAWRGSTLRDRVLAAGHRVLVSAPYYLDLNYPVDVHYGFDPAAAQAELVAREDALLTDPRFAAVAEGIRWTEHWRDGAIERAAPGSDPRLLGGEACLWGELVTSDVLDTRLWSRLPAVAERFWSAADRVDAASVHDRLEWLLDDILPAAGIDLKVRQRAAFEMRGVTGEWRVLMALLEPVRWYGRLLGAEALAARIEGRELPQARPYDLSSPLDGLVDHLPPESREARRVAALCRAAADGDEAAAGAVEKMLARWRSLAARADEAPPLLVTLASRLGRLADLIEARLERGIHADVQTVVEVGAPVGELSLAVPPALFAWLTAH